MSHVAQLQLHDFRCYDHAAMADIAPGLIVLTGANGAGKTNILEAVSLLSPGRGLRSAANEDMIRRSASSATTIPSVRQGDRWAISAEIVNNGVTAQIGTGLDEGGKRIVRINGAAAKSQMALSDYIACVWLTPQMDRLFLDSSGARRRFFDKLIFAFDPAHAGRVTRYENAMAQRSRLLREGGADAVWLASLESQMAETGTAIAAARLDFLGRLQKACDLAHEQEETWFPKARLQLSGTLEELLSRSPAVEVEEMFAYQLAQSRGRDAETGGAATGPHKGDMLVHFAVKGMPADQCSTGEQKALLIGIILAHARLMRSERGAPPVLLLDEVAAHLDENRRSALFDLLVDLGGQVWMTGTDESLFSAALKRGQFWGVDRGEISKK